MSAAAQPLFTLDQYLALEREAETRSEFIDGYIYAMSGGSHNHARIIGNCFGCLLDRLRNGPCEVYPSDLRVQAGQFVTYPDLSVVCGEPRFHDTQTDTLTNPQFLIEVLSPSTERHDRGLKSARYRSIETLAGYLLVSQDEPHVELYARQPGGQWLLTEFVGLEAICQIPSLGIEIPLSEIYRKVTFNAADKPM